MLKKISWRLRIISILILSAINVSAQTITPQPSSTPAQSILPYTIDALTVRGYSGGIIHIRSTESTNSGFMRYYVDYPSDDLTIIAMMNVPVGEGPFPVIVMLHGYYDRGSYWSGVGTWQEADYLARSGYLTIAPDFRTCGVSESGVNFFATGLMIDTFNLISSLPSVPQADTAWVGIWGHSMGTV